MDLRVFNNSNSIKDKNKTANNKKNQISFKGMLGFANFMSNNVFAPMQTSEVLAPSAVDVVSMVIPRTTIDYTRSPDAGRETGTRELAGLINNCILPGFVTAFIGFALGKFIQPKIPVRTFVPIHSDTLDILSGAWKNSNGKRFWQNGLDDAGKKGVVKDFVAKVFEDAYGLIGQESKGGGWKSLKKIISNSKDSAGAAEKLFEDIADSILVSEKSGGKRHSEINKRFIEIFGAGQHIKVNYNGKTIETKSENLLRGIYNSGREIFIKIKPQNIADDLPTEALAKFTKTTKYKTAIGLSIMLALGFVQQYVNRKITEKKTGCAAFVGIPEEYRRKTFSPEEEEAKKRKLRYQKAASMGVIIFMAASTLAWSLNPRKILNTLKPQNLVKKLEFKGYYPSLDQLRSVIYPSLLLGRIAASADNNELRETNTRDIPGFLNWLVLGDFVAKGTAKWLSKGELINSSKAMERGFLKRIIHFLTSQSIVTHAEIDARKGIDQLQKNSLKTKLNWSITSGLIYSTLALGVFMPLYNKYSTNKRFENQKKENGLQQSHSQKIPEPNNKTVPLILSLGYRNAGFDPYLFADFINTEKHLLKLN